VLAHEAVLRERIGTRAVRARAGVEAAGAVERGEVVVAADVALADIDLGTVRRPVRCIISSRALGLEVDADSSRSRHALRLEQALGHDAEGHTPVEYIRTLAMALLLHRQARLLPGGEAALQLEDLGEARLLQERQAAPARVPLRR
jgi:hypothetical protein